MATAAIVDKVKIGKFIQQRTVFRHPKKKPPRRYYLIVCEGEKTEPNYFEALKKRLPKDMVKRICIKGEGKNTLSLIGSAEKEVEKRYLTNLPPFYHVWLVFDRDSFPESDFNDTIRKSTQKTRPQKQYWHCAWSNEAFELWYLLHFDAHVSPISRQAYQAKLESCLKKIGVNRKYKKNAIDMYEILEELQQNAIKNAEITLKKQQEREIPFSQMNPATTVHNLVKELIRYID